MIPEARGRISTCLSALAWIAPPRRPRWRFAPSVAGSVAILTALSFDSDKEMRKDWPGRHSFDSGAGLRLG